RGIRRLECLRGRAVVVDRGARASLQVDEGRRAGALEQRPALRVHLEVQDVVEHEGEERTAAVQAMAAEHRLCLQASESAEQLSDMSGELRAHFACSTSRRE